MITLTPEAARQIERAWQEMLDFERDYTTMPYDDFHRKYGPTFDDGSKRRHDLRRDATEALAILRSAIAAPQMQQEETIGAAAKVLLANTVGIDADDAYEIARRMLQAAPQSLLGSKESRP